MALKPWGYSDMPAMLVVTGGVHLPDRRWPSSWSQIQRTEVLSEGGEFGSQKCQDLE